MHTVNIMTAHSLDERSLYLNLFGELSKVVSEYEAIVSPVEVHGDSSYHVHSLRQKILFSIG